VLHQIGMIKYGSLPGFSKKYPVHGIFSSNLFFDIVI